MGQGDQSPLQQRIFWTIRPRCSRQHTSQSPCLCREIPSSKLREGLVQTSKPKSSDTYGEQQGRRGALMVALDRTMW